MNKAEHIKAREIAIKLLSQLEGEIVSFDVAQKVVDIMAVFVSDDARMHLSTTPYFQLPF